MDLFFGLDKPAAAADGTSLFATLYDDILVEMYEALLREEQIPYLKKDRSGGGAIRILTGNNPHGTDIYVPDAYLERAKALLLPPTDDVPYDDVDAVTEEENEE